MEKYNGWANRETWALALHLDNDSYLQSYMHALSKNHLDERELENTIRDFVEELFASEELSKDLRTMICDVGSLWRVDWREIARHYHDET